MRVALNLHGFLPGSGGVETYLVNLIKALHAAPQGDEYVLLTGQRSAGLFPANSDNLMSKVSSYDTPGFWWLARGGLKRLTGYDLLVRDINAVDADVVHHPLTILNPAGAKAPAVLTVHDLQQEFFPEFFSKSELDQRRKTYRASVEEAERVIAISEHCKTGLLEIYGVPSNKVTVVHHGVSPAFSSAISESCLEEVRRSFRLDAPALIYPAATWPHKNHLRLLQALKILVDRGRFDGILLLTGAPKQGQEDVASEIVKLGLEERVRWLGYVTDETLIRLYRLARLMVFPSLFEGFGLPVLEAMAAGCPVACADATSLPEITGQEGAQLFDPLSVEDMARAIDQVWNDDTRRKKLALGGERRAAQFTWEDAAQKTVSVYRSVL